MVGIKNKSGRRKGFIMSEEHKSKISQKNLGKTAWNRGLSKENQPMFGKSLSEETKQKISNSENGKYVSVETRNKLRVANKDKHNSIKTEFKSEQAKERRKSQVFPLKDTKIEIKIQNFLKQLNIDFFTHQYIKEIEHGYQCDILIPSMNLVIECDGDYWHKYPVGNEIDHIRTSELLQKGFKVLRLWEHEIKEMDINKFHTIIGID